MLEQFRKLAERHEAIQRELADPAVAAAPERSTQLAKEAARLAPLVHARDRYLAITRELDALKADLHGDDPEWLKMAEAERQELGQRQADLLRQMEDLLLAEDPQLSRDVILEIRAGTGGEEAALFAADLFRMYNRFAQRHGLRVELMDTNITEIGGFKEIIFSICGAGAYRRLRFESGTHRVQRVPRTESSGRIHTSAATVYVVPEAEERELVIQPKDLRVDVFRASGPGGQSVNTTDSAVRITYLPTGLIVTCRDEKSQHKNKAKAMRVLRSRLVAADEEKRQSQISRERRTAIGSGDRSEKIRTYNFPDRRVTDHRIGLTIHRLEGILDGDLDEMIQALEQADRQERLKTAAQQGG